MSRHCFFRALSLYTRPELAGIVRTASGLPMTKEGMDAEKEEITRLRELAHCPEKYGGDDEAQILSDALGVAVVLLKIKPCGDGPHHQAYTYDDNGIEHGFVHVPDHLRDLPPTSSMTVFLLHTTRAERDAVHDWRGGCLSGDHYDLLVPVSKEPGFDVLCTVPIECAPIAPLGQQPENAEHYDAASPPHRDADNDEDEKVEYGNRSDNIGDADRDCRDELLAEANKIDHDGANKDANDCGSDGYALMEVTNNTVDTRRAVAAGNNNGIADDMCTDTTTASQPPVGSVGETHHTPDCGDEHRERDGVEALEKRFKCPVESCASAYKSRQGLQKHVRTKHAEISPESMEMWHASHPTTSADDDRHLIECPAPDCSMLIMVRDVRKHVQKCHEAWAKEKDCFVDMTFPSREAFEDWLNTYEKVTGVQFRNKKQAQSNKSIYVCNRHQSNTRTSAPAPTHRKRNKPLGKTRKCAARVFVTFSSDGGCKVEMQNLHSHAVGEENLKFTYMSDDMKSYFGYQFLDGKTKEQIYNQHVGEVVEGVSGNGMVLIYHVYRPRLVGIGVWFLMLIT